jgi:hypothetical protein
MTLATRDFYAPWSDDLGSSLKMTSGKCHEMQFIVVDWDQFKQFLLQRTNAKTTGGRLRYAKKFVSVLQTGDAQPLLLQVTPDKRIHAMKALASLSRFLGCYDTWLQIRQRYNLKWSTGNENLAAFERFFDDSKTLDSMLQWVREAIKVLPAAMGEIIKFNCMTGLRPNETIQAVRLLNSTSSSSLSSTPQKRGSIYYNQERQTLEHFRFPEIFLRRTKSAYISIIELEQLSAIAQMRGKTPTYEVLRFRLERAGVKCHLGYCRKIFGSWLRKEGIESETVDLLQGRVPRTVFARNYFSPDSSLRRRVLDSLYKLQQAIISQ